MARMTPRINYLTWKLRALCWVLRRMRAGRAACVAGVNVAMRKEINQ